ncbi:hypothetical protein CYFUS_007345 [Cystobacter fuscus]|uniref:Dickkopf N-terminal cysteine-rich domain-containing protein n=1 Tax=Cystobacter fuscus TaxID=43 RepID=A0A250JD81_9BACT|nr:hypothetical protein CYFUS_007345 [Cystobacter fuscus]
MSWRAAAALVLGLLFPLPLLWSLGLLPVHGLQSTSLQESRKVVPRLSAEQLKQLPTAGRACRGDADCDAPLVCLRGLLMIQPVCAASRCMTDLDCQEGFACRAVQVGERVVRVCGAMGTQKEGEWCLKVPFDQDSACAPGLVCAAFSCGRRCRPQDPQGCSPGFACLDVDAEGPVCLPSCDGMSCPEGQRCVQLRKGGSLCVQVHGRDCQHDELCPEPQVCDVFLGARPRHDEAWMECVLPCVEDGPSCPSGMVCYAKRCRQLCSKQNEARVCAPRESCHVEPGTTSGVCQMDR